MKLEKTKSVIVTGCAGFIGARTTEMLLDQGYKVIGIDNINNYYDSRLKLYRLYRIYGMETEFIEKFFDENSKNIDINAFISELYRNNNSKKNFTFYLIDIEDEEKIDDLLSDIKPSAVINLAARAGVRASLDNPKVYVETNITGCLNLLESCRRNEVPKFILASTSSLYAGQQMPFSENLPVNTPISPYAATKKAAEMLCYTWHFLYGLDVTILRFFTVYGPASRPDMSILRFIFWVDQGIPIKVYGDGKQSRDFTYIDDIAKGNIASLSLCGHHVINLGGGGNPVNLIVIIKVIEELIGKKARIKFEPFEKSDVLHTQANNKNASDILGWYPVTDIYKGLEKSVNWYIENRKWCKKLSM